jgi:hypothetical protein
MPKVTLTDIVNESSFRVEYNANNARLRTAFENTLSRDGSTPNSLLADIDMNSNKILNVANGTNATDAVNLGQLQSIVAATDHGLLSGLNDDDHPQYLNEARAIAFIDAQVDKTFVDALNVDADTLDGNDSTAFAAASHNHTVPVHFQLSCSDLSTALEAATSVGYFRAPQAFTLTEVRASLLTAGSSASTIDININGTTALGTKITIDASEKTSETAATAPVISTSAVADDAEITVDIDTAGTDAAGLIVTLIGTLTV